MYKCIYIHKYFKTANFSTSITHTYMYIYICIIMYICNIYVCVCVCVYVYIYIICVCVYVKCIQETINMCKVYVSIPSIPACF